MVVPVAYSGGYLLVTAVPGIGFVVFAVGSYSAPGRQFVGTVVDSAAVSDFDVAGVAVAAVVSVVGEIVVLAAVMQIDAVE